MSKLEWFYGALCAATLLACGDDTGRAPLAGEPDAGAPPQTSHADFQSSACKKSLDAKSSLARRYLGVIDDQKGLDGLRCIAWRRIGADELKLDLYNFDSACGTTWVGDAALRSDGTLELGIDNPSCSIALCGKCLYDWSFDVHATIPAAQMLPVTITVNTCKGQQTPVQLVTTIGAEESGMRCSFADYGGLLWQASATQTCGALSMPCQGSSLCGSGSVTSTGTCNDGLVCDSSDAVNEPRCLVPCTTSDDCPRADAWSCQSGLCRPNAEAPSVLP